MPFIVSFAALYILNTLIAQNMRIFTPEPKTITASPTLYTLLTFPHVTGGTRKRTSAKKQGLTLSELLFCSFNQLILIAAMILQLVPAIPCDPIEISFGRGYRWLDLTVTAYNQKIPLAVILALLCVEALVLFGDILLRAVRDTEFRKKLGKGAFIGTAALCLLFLAVCILSLSMLF